MLVDLLLTVIFGADIKAPKTKTKKYLQPKRVEKGKNDEKISELENKIKSSIEALRNEENSEEETHKKILLDNVKDISDDIYLIRSMFNNRACQY